MVKQLFKLLKKCILSVFLVYGFNILANPLGILIPINMLTISIITLFGIPSLLSLIALLLIVF